MFLTDDYQELQNIKKQMIKDNIKSEKKIYECINVYKDTLNYLFRNNLVKDISKEDLENDLSDLATNLLKNTKKSYDMLDKQYHAQTLQYYYIHPTNEIRLQIKN